MSHTPGPWVIYRNRKGHVSKIEGSGGHRICTFQPSDQFVEGNSQIIVTALEMRDEIARLKKEKAELLEALEIAKSIIDTRIETPVVAGYSKIEDAIKKARGEE
ncbi:hypothetical protein L2W58_08135 [Dethiosulfovibrio sp. F2B]|uniref:hypothetical protein n=1 Tax=Dethiosulfovibrio faecalis TaxID=2720018 RepID=UPI001F349D7D|nr:hypothetical protein [Dethiosulfovibrio faecalis]MCF4151770.1 hypothetical protein [Dethiosulfovibrio faecalis]